MHRGEEGTRDEVGGCWPSPATGPKAQLCSACRAGRKIAGSCTSEGLRCDCQEKQGFKVEITRSTSRSKSGHSKTLLLHTSPQVLILLLLPASPGLSSLAKCHPNAHQHHAPPKTWLSCWAPPSRLEAGAVKLAPHTCAHTQRSFPSPFPWLSCADQESDG